MGNRDECEILYYTILYYAVQIFNINLCSKDVSQKLKKNQTQLKKHKMYWCLKRVYNSFKKTNRSGDTVSVIGLVNIQYSYIE